MTGPRMPSRTRLYRPDLYSDDVTGPLPPEVRDLYLALGGCADDHGWMPWRVALLGARIYPYRAVAEREADLTRWAARLVADGLLVMHPCGCAYLPRLVRDLATRSGQPSYAIEEHHQRHATATVRQPAPAEAGALPRTTPMDGDGDRDGYGDRAHDDMVTTNARDGADLDGWPSRAWRGWDPRWQPYAVAMAEQHGCATPPPGDQDDEASARGRLWHIVRDNPNRLAAWVRELPAGSTPRAVVGHVFQSDKDLQRAVGRGTERVGDVLPRVLAGPPDVEGDA